MNIWHRLAHWLKSIRCNVCCEIALRRYDGLCGFCYRHGTRLALKYDTERSESQKVAELKAAMKGRT